MGNASIHEGLIDSQIGLHDGIVGGGKDGVHSVAHQCLGGLLDLGGVGAGALHVLNALGVQILLGMGDGGGRGVLAHIVEEADLLCVWGDGEDQVHDGICVQIVRGTSDVGAGGFQRSYQPGAHRVGDGGEDHRGVVPLHGCLHCHGYGSGNAHHQVYLVGLEVGNDLVHHGSVGIGIVIGNVKGDALLLADLVQSGLNVFIDLIEGGVVHIVA